MRRSWLSLLAALTTAWTLPARAQQGEPGEPAAEPAPEAGDEDAAAGEESDAPPEKPRTVTEEPEEDEGPEQPLAPLPVNSLGGHLMISASALWAIPFAGLESGIDQADWLSSGPGIGAEIAYGVSRTVAVGAWGQMLFLDEAVDCDSCKTQSVAGGLFVRYHLVQGLRFDPWMSAGLGYRMTSIDDPRGDRSYSGIEWLHVAVGGDWYALRNFGFGPYMELDMGRYMSRDPELSDDSANHWHFITGARITFDAPGR